MGVIGSPLQLQVIDDIFLDGGSFSPSNGVLMSFYKNLGTKLKITRLGEKVIEATILSGSNQGQTVLIIHRVNL